MKKTLNTQYRTEKVSWRKERKGKEAVQNNNIQMVQLLLDYKANIHKANNAALYLAAKEGKTQIVELLIGNVGSLAN